LIERRAKPASVEGERHGAMNFVSGHRRIDTIVMARSCQDELSDQKPSIHTELPKAR